MLRTITIEGFRGLKSLRLAGLGRVNLLVGSNNSGKTTVLEAVQLLATGGDLGMLLAGLRRRDERAPDSSDDPPYVNFDARHLFHGRVLDGDPIQLRATDDDGPEAGFSVSAPKVLPEFGDRIDFWQKSMARARRAAVRRSPLQQPLLFDEDTDTGERYPRLLQVRNLSGDIIGQAPLLNGSNLVDEEQLLRNPRVAGPVHFIATSSLAQHQLARLLDRAVLTDELPAAIEALSTVEEGITRIAAVDDGRSRRIVVGLRDVPEPVPLGSMGDGMARMLALGLSLVAARDGYLLVDEIDTGLHFSVMRKMWRLVFETARRLNVCVYATTHSYDCVHALAEIAKPDGRADGDVALLRVERGFPSAIHFDEKEISLLAAREIEAR